MSSQAAAYTNLVGVMAKGSACANMGTRVVAGNSAMSLLYTKVTVPTCGSRMPRNAGPLTAADVATIKGWIDGGAHND